MVHRYGSVRILRSIKIKITWEVNPPERGFKMRSITENDVQFRGQYADVLLIFKEGEIITFNDFTNGKWEATTQLSHFIYLLDKAKIKYINVGGDSLRKTRLIIYND